jgi:hypothetical protein
MQGSLAGFSCRLLFAFQAIIVSAGVAVAQDMPPVLAPLTVPAASNPAPVSPSAQAAIPPAAQAVIPPAAPAVPATKPIHTAANHHAKDAKPHHPAKFAALAKRLAAHSHPVTHHVAAAHVAAAPALPPGAQVPPPGYYGPAPYQRLVYGGPPPGMYGGWGGGYRGRHPYYP